jgi:hypothetical protein
MELSASAWLEVIEREYLEDFVREGGAAVKFVVPSDETSRRQILEGLCTAAAFNNFQYAFVDSATTKLHLIDRLFHEVARQIDWDAICHAFLTRLLTENGIELPAAGALTVPALAELNGFPEAPFRMQVNRWITNALFHDYAMNQEFRLAMIALCQAQLDPDADPALAGAIREWLRGELRLTSAVKRALIFQKIARHNARSMLLSLAHWLRIGGRSGLVLAIDIARYTDARRPSEREGGFSYSSAAALDAYEVLRQLIDGTDELEFGLICVLASPSFLSDDRRGLRAYHALYLRVSDEVRDRYRQNPLASLARLEAHS